MDRDDPIAAAISEIAKNQVLVAGKVDNVHGAALKGSFEREKGGIAGGVTGEVAQKSGWGLTGFFRWVWK